MPYFQAKIPLSFLIKGTKSSSLGWRPVASNTERMPRLALKAEEPEKRNFSEDNIFHVLFCLSILLT